jgi:hypothetical protein
MAPFGSRLDVRVSDLWYMDAVGKISGWTGVHGSEYEGQISRLQWYVGLWSGLALIFPFLAALLLGLGKGTGPSRSQTSRASIVTCPEVSHEWTAVTPIVAYLLRVAISAIASLAFIILFVFVVGLLETWACVRASLHPQFPSPPAKRANRRWSHYG